MPHSQEISTIEKMPPGQPSLRAQFLACWNWKCALMSSSARSLVYLAALARSGRHDRVSIVLVEVAYVALTAGVYAGLQQRALALRSQFLGNLTVAFVVPMFAQFIDWAAHRVAGAPVPFRAMVAVSIFACVSAFFHLYVMRRGVFLSGQGRSLREDFRRIPRLVIALVISLLSIVMAQSSRAESAAESEAVL